MLAILFVINIKFKFFNNKVIVMITSTLGIVMGVIVGSFVYLVPLTR